MSDYIVDNQKGALYMPAYFAVLQVIPVPVAGEMVNSRVMVYDRRTTQCIHVKSIDSKPLLNFNLPIVYSTTNDLLVGMVDDTRDNNCTFVDGVQPVLMSYEMVSELT